MLLLCEQYTSACDYVPLALLVESSTLFAFFTPVSLSEKKVFAQKTPHGTPKEISTQTAFVAPALLY
jgi:hypothetical protein